MKGQLYEQEQARKVKTRFRMLQHAQKISHNVSQTCRFFGISRYNEQRPHLALKGKTPAERVQELARPSQTVRNPLD